MKRHHSSESSLWVGFNKKKRDAAGLQYSGALDAALCFGWIDGVRKKIDAETYMIRFSPRKPRSIWSRVNIQRAMDLSAAGRMQPPGLKALASRREEGMDRYSYEQGELQLPEPYVARFRHKPEAWRYFQGTPLGYQRKATWWIMSAKQESTRERRLQTILRYLARTNG